MLISRTNRYATPNSTPSDPNTLGTARATTNIAAIAANIPARTSPSSGLEGVREPGVTRPRPPDRREDQQPATEAAPGEVARHELGDLGDREHDDEVEEQLERRDALLAFDRSIRHPTPAAEEEASAYAQNGRER